MPFDTKKLSKYSIKPGVYLMKGRSGQVLYVGKAKNLRNRLRQYFVKGGDGRYQVPFLIPHVDDIETIIVTSEKEALLLENNLIKKYKPKYNALLKDDKSYIALRLSNHKWPRVDIVRYRGQPEPGGTYFGPYTNAYGARKTLDLLHRLFPIRQCSDKEFARRTRPCILYDMKRCIAPCVNLCTKEEYDVLVDKTVRFLKGQDKEILKDLYKEMECAAVGLEFEKAGEILKTIRQIEQAIEGQVVDVPFGADADALAIYREAQEAIVCRLIFRKGRLTGSRHYDFSQIAEDDHELLVKFILQRYSQEFDFPHEILIPVQISEAKALEEILSANRTSRVKIVSPKKGNKKSLVEMAYLNAEATFKKEKDETAIRENILFQMKELLRLNSYPKRIECFDNSNIFGEENVSAMAVFTDGKKDSGRYRKYKIRTVEGIDDYAAFFEVLQRRYSRAQKENDLPDLLVVDGGKGHLNVALRVMKELNIISVDVISVAKEMGRHDKGVTREQIFLPNVKDPVLLKTNSPILHLLQKIRDEAHRFAVTFHRKRRSKKIIRSALDDIPGIGPVKRKRLLKHFGSLKKIKEAAREELLQVKGISKMDVESILKLN